VTAAGVVSIVVALVTVLVLAAYLIYVVFALRRVSARLRAILAGLALIPGKTAPISPVLSEINHDLATVDSRLRVVLTRDRQPKVSAPELPARWVVAPRYQGKGNV
jgi:hypothetical protein